MCIRDSGQMMQRDLSIVEILKFAAENHSDSEVISLRTEGYIHRYNYRGLSSQSLQIG